MRTILKLIMALLLFSSTGAIAQNKAKVYDVNADAEKDIAEAVQLAEKEGKHILLKVGGNWCPWCIRFHKFIYDDADLKKIVNDNYVVVNVNYDKKNKQTELMKRLGYPHRFGFPVLVVLDEKGDRIHTQKTSYLEKGKGYEKQEVMEFLLDWTPKTLDPKNYKK